MDGGDEGGLNELLDSMGGWVGGWEGGPTFSCFFVLDEQRDRALQGLQFMNCDRRKTTVTKGTGVDVILERPGRWVGGWVVK